MAHLLLCVFQDGRYSMLVMLPKKRNGIKELIRDLPHNGMDKILNQMGHQDVIVLLPRFEITFEKDLVETLQQLQISKTFGPDADFQSIVKKVNDTFQVSNIFHSAKIKVNEEGSEAAAATGKKELLALNLFCHKSLSLFLSPEVYRVHHFLKP